MLAIACLSLYSVPAQSAQKVEYGRGTSGTTCSIDSNGNCTSLPESTSLQIFNSKNHIGPSNLASKAGDATNNEIIYASESINGSVWGARSNSDDVSLNNVTIQSGNIGEFVYGAYTDGSGKSPLKTQLILLVALSGIQSTADIAKMALPRTTRFLCKLET